MGAEYMLIAYLSRTTDRARGGVGDANAILKACMLSWYDVTY